MAVTGTTSRNDYVADGSTEYAFTFPAQESSWVQVLLDGVVQGSGYTVALSADQTSSPGGTVTFLSGPTTGRIVRIQRVVTLTQSVKYSAYASFPAATHEAALDKAMMAVQDIDRDRADLASKQAADVIAEMTNRVAGDASSRAYSSLLLASIGAPEANAARITAQEIHTYGYLNAKTFGAGPDKTSAQNAVALQGAMDATPAGGTLVIPGSLRCNAKLTRTAGQGPITIRGFDQRTGNVSDGSLSTSLLLFDNDSHGFEVTGTCLALESLIVSGIGSGDYGTPSTNYGIKLSGANNALILKDSVVQSFHRGISAAGGYYHKLVDSSIEDCVTDLFFDYCYNIHASGMKLVAATAAGQCIELINGSSMTMHGGSIESFKAFGASLYDGSSLNLFGTYFEGASAAAWCVLLAAQSRVTAIGCQVYLNNGTDPATNNISERWISVEGGGALGTRVYSRNNRLAVAEGVSTKTAIAYTPLSADDISWWDVDGDNWPDAPAANARYTINEFIPGKGHHIKYPVNHALFQPKGQFVGVPANAAAPGRVGDWSTDASHVYHCVAADTWVRAAVATWP